MRYDTLRTGALSHRAIAATSLLAVALSVAAAGIVTAAPDSNVATARYLFNYSLAHRDDGTLVVRTRIVDSKNDEVLGEPTIIAKPGVPSSTEITREGLRLRIDLTPDGNGGGRIELVAHENDKLVQQTAFNLEPQRSERAAAYSGAKISLNLKDADLKDVFGTFGKLTGLEIVTDPDVHGKVTMQFTDTPWDEALDRIIKDNGCASTLEGKRLHIFVKR